MYSFIKKSLNIRLEQTRHIRAASAIMRLLCLASAGIMISLPSPTANIFANGAHNIKLGPPNAGQGGSGPLGLPPNIQDIEYSYISDDDQEFSVSIFPGIFYGFLHRHEKIYTGIGAGLVVSANAVGYGSYFSIGYVDRLLSSINYNIEYKQAFGYNYKKNLWTAPSALRLGLMKSF